MGREFALVGGEVFDAGATGWLTDRAVHVQGTRIAAVLPAAELPPESAVERVDVAGGFILPGLIDVHVHSEDWHAPLYLANRRDHGARRGLLARADDRAARGVEPAGRVRAALGLHRPAARRRHRQELDRHGRDHPHAA